MNKIALCGLCLITSNVFGVLASERPNIIVIMADDMGWGDVGFNGNTIIKTPSFGCFGFRWSDYGAILFCRSLSSQARASVLTGRHPFRTGVFSANVGILRKRSHAS